MDAGADALKVNLRRFEVYAGMDWVDGDLAKKSMTLMAEKVMPKVREAIG